MIRPSAIGFLMLGLTGCAVGPKYNRPDIYEPAQYAQRETIGDSITNMKWWEVYQDTVLQDLIQETLDQNLDLKSAVARVEEAKAVLGYNKANVGPWVDYIVHARSTEFRENSSEAGVAFPTNSFALLGNISWEIDIWGKLKHANRAAYAELLASEEDRRAIYLSLVAQVAELYFNLRGLDERSEITRRTLETRQEYLRIITLRFERGEVAELDKLQAEQIAASSAAQLYAIERETIAVENAINILMARSYSAVPRGLLNNIQQLPLEIPSGLPSQLLARRPDVRASEWQLIAQTERIGVAVAMRFPTLSLTGLFGVASPELGSVFDAGSFAGSITGQLTGPIFRFGQNKRRVEIEQARALQAANGYEFAVLNAFAEVENALTEVRTFHNEYSAREIQVRATEKSLVLSKALYDNGYTSFLQVLDAERELYSAQLDQSFALQNQLIASVKLYKALGGGW